MLGVLKEDGALTGHHDVVFSLEGGRALGMVNVRNAMATGGVVRTVRVDHDVSTIFEDGLDV